MGDVIEISDVLQENRGVMNPGRLKLQPSGIAFKNNKTGLLLQLAAEDIRRAVWQLRARGHCLRVSMAGGDIHKFDGLAAQEFERLQNFLRKHYSASLDKQDASAKGWNYGSTKFSGNMMSFNVDHVPAFELPLNNVSAAHTKTNEVTLEFHQDDDAQVALMEMRFHIPNENNVETDPVEEFQQKVLEKADIIQLSAGECICTFTEVQCLTPRGRYDVKLYPTFLQLHGKTFDYKLPYTSILRLFLLPHKDGRQMYFVMSLDPPIKQGMTRWHFVICLFSKEEEEKTLSLQLSEEDITEKYAGKLQPEMSGEMFEIFSRVLKVLVQRKITVPGSYSSTLNTHCLTCSYKANAGLLYPLERGFIFVHKPPVHVRFDEVSGVNFGRSSSSLKTFDFHVETRSGGTYTFNGLEKNEFSNLHRFVQERKLRVLSGGKLDSDTVKYDGMDDSDSGSEHDAYLERMKREGKQRDEDDDSMDSDDEEFRASDLSASEVEEEFDSEFEGTSDEDSDEDATASDKERKREVKEKRREEKREEAVKRKERREKRKESGGSKSRKRRSKQKSDPNRPKRAQTAFFLWQNEMRPKFKEENPTASITDITKIAGAKWKALEDKSEWEAKAAKDKERYAAAMKEYEQNLKDNPPSDDSDEDTPKKKKASTKKFKPSTESPTKKGSGADFKSKEFIESSDESSAIASSDDEAANDALSD